MKNIHIPEPCHENWADFTPTQKGAFCGSCQIDVVDFSNKSPEEVKAILKANAGKHMCGRFKKSQMEELNNDFFAWKNQSTKSFQSKFLYACLIAFGMTLFTSCTLTEQNILGQLGQSAEFNETQLNLLDLNNTEDKDSTKTRNDERHHIKGKVAYNPQEQKETKDSTECELPANEEEDLHIKGEIIAQPEEIPGNVVMSADSTEQISSEDSLYDDMMIDGEIEWTPQFESFIEDTTDAIDSVQQNNLPESIDNYPYDNNAPTSPNTLYKKVFDSSLFPNPSNDNATVVINVNQKNLFDIYLYAINGKYVKTIYKGMLESGRREFVLDLTAYQAGSYLIVVNSNSQKESLRLEKL